MTRPRPEKKRAAAWYPRLWRRSGYSSVVSVVSSTAWSSLCIAIRMPPPGQFWPIRDGTDVIPEHAPREGLIGHVHPPSQSEQRRKPVSR